MLSVYEFEKYDDLLFTEFLPTSVRCEMTQVPYEILHKGDYFIELKSAVTTSISHARGVHLQFIEWTPCCRQSDQTTRSTCLLTYLPTYLGVCAGASRSIVITQPGKFHSAASGFT